MPSPPHTPPGLPLPNPTAPNHPPPPLRYRHEPDHRSARQRHNSSPPAPLAPRHRPRRDPRRPPAQPVAKASREGGDARTSLHLGELRLVWLPGLEHRQRVHRNPPRPPHGRGGTRHHGRHLAVSHHRGNAQGTRRGHVQRRQQEADCRPDRGLHDHRWRHRVLV